MLHPFDGFVAGDHHLGDAVAGMDFEWLAAEVLEDDADFTAIAGIDCCRAVGERDRMLQSESATRADLRLEARQQFDRQTGWNQFRFAGSEGDRFDRVQVHAGIFFRTMRVAGNDRIIAQTSDAEAV